MQVVEAPRFDPPLDRSNAEAGSQQLPPGYDSVLPIRQRG
jgi:hypothetical protein